MASPVADIAKSYADLGSHLLQRWSDHGSKVGKRLDEGTYDTDSAVADLTKFAMLATETGVLLWNEALEAVTSLASPSGPYIVESEPFDSPLAGAELRPAGPFVNAHGSGTFPASTIRIDPSKLKGGETQFILSVDATRKCAGTYRGHVEAADAGNVQSVEAWIIVA
jgi:hypothetical protein